MPGNDAHAAHREQLVNLLEPSVAAAGFELDELALQRAGRRMVLRVVIDGDAGVSLDEAAALSRQFSRLLDDAATDDMFGPMSYMLEVTSPGVDRPLTEPRHWRRNQGRLVRATTSEGEFVGRIERADDAEVTLLVDAERKILPYALLRSGAVELEFRRPEETV